MGSETIRQVHGIKLHLELPNIDVYLLVQGIKDSTTEINKYCVLAEYLYFSLGDVSLTSVRQSSLLLCSHFFSQVQGRFSMRTIMRRLFRTLQS